MISLVVVSVLCAVVWALVLGHIVPEHPDEYWEEDCPMCLGEGCDYCDE